MKMSIFQPTGITCQSVTYLKRESSIQPEPEYNEGPRDWQNLFAIERFRNIELLFHIFYYNWGKENGSLYRDRCLLCIRDRYCISRFHCNKISLYRMYIEVYLPTCFSITGEGPGISFVSTDRESNFVAHSPGSLNRGPTVAVNKP